MTAADLTAAELDIVQRLLAGKSVRQVAEARHRCTKTVESQVWTLMHKLGFNNKTQLGAWAERHGIRESTT